MRVLENAVHEVLTYCEDCTSYNESKKDNLKNELLGNSGVFKNCSIVSYIILPITRPKKVEGELSSDLGMT